MKARSLIIATGAEAIWLDADGEEEVKGKGVSTCATCDGAFYEGKEVGFLSTGEAARGGGSVGRGEGRTHLLLALVIWPLTTNPF